MSNKTRSALIRRGISTSQAEFIINNGFNISKLQLMSKQELEGLGLNEADIEKIHDKSRPPIPEEIINKVLYEAKFTCCICRDSSKPIIIHHIKPWSESHSHAEENLVVLCVDHHDEVHTKHEHSINLTEHRVRDAKKKWLALVKGFERESALGIIKQYAACWDYFNINRIYELTDNLKIDVVKENKYFNALFKAGYVSEEGWLVPINNSWPIEIKISRYWLDFVGGYNNIGLFFATIMKKIINKADIKVLNRIWNKNKLASIVRSGDIVIYNGVFCYKKLNKVTVGPNQDRLGYTKSGGIRLEFNFDLWYSNSNSAYIDHLTGRTDSTVCAIIREIINEKDMLTLKCTALSIGCGYNFFDYNLGERETSLDMEI